MKSKNKKLFAEGGITLIEIIVSIAIITILSMMVITDFPKILRDFALSRAVYKMSQDIRKTEDLGLSGVQISGQTFDAAGGYGVYINPNVKVNSGIPANKQYTIYADTCQPAQQEYNTSSFGTGCPDSIIETINIGKEEPGVSIKEVDDLNNNNLNTGVSINFNPPNPDIKITTDYGDSESGVTIVFYLDYDQSTTRTVSINASGLVQVK